MGIGGKSWTPQFKRDLFVFPFLPFPIFPSTVSTSDDWSVTALLPFLGLSRGVWEVVASRYLHTTIGLSCGARERR